MSKNDIGLSNNDWNSKIVFALSSLLRHFPYVQLKFLEFGGVNILNDFMQKSPSYKLKVKILTLVDDLIQEKVNLFNSVSKFFFLKKTSLYFRTMFLMRKKAMIQILYSN